MLLNSVHSYEYVRSINGSKCRRPRHPNLQLQVGSWRSKSFTSWKGRAIDIFIPTLSGWVADNSKGDIIANWLIDNAEELGIQSLIWDRTIWKASGPSPRHRCYSGQSAHVDHIHAELSWTAARKETVFFTNGSEVIRPPEPIPSAWIGELCESESDCINAPSNQNPLCLENGSDYGVCSFACLTVFVPDLSGKPTSFCISSDVLSQQNRQGLCVLKSESNMCLVGVPATIETHSRYVGMSSASPLKVESASPLF